MLRSMGLKILPCEIGQIFKIIRIRLDSVIAVTTAKFALFNIQSVMDLTKKDTLDMKTWGQEKSMVYLVIPDNDSTFHFLSALFFQLYFKP